MQTDNSKIFARNSHFGQRIVDALHEQGIAAVIKVEAESALRSGFASAMRNTVELCVKKDELVKSNAIIDAQDTNP